MGWYFVMLSNTEQRLNTLPIGNEYTVLQHIHA